MTEQRPIVHLICNAHLDPVWMWAWEEGAREAISTFHTAADLLAEFPEFIFNHNESLLYEWVEEYDPPLFARIKRYVAEGRWHVTGGWYLQPDCNLPGGETLIRLILEGRTYFAEKFGMQPGVAYNFDTFGHPGSLPQLLKQSGFSLYIHCRPTVEQLELPAPFYRWRGIDGSVVIGVRPDTGWYCTPGSGQAQKQTYNGIEIARETGMDTLVLWGLGDHGGGATREDLERFRDIIAETADGDVIVRHSTPEAFLARIQDKFETFPMYEGELQRTLAGTYTSVASIKRQTRQTEALLASAERWASLAWWRYGYAYPADELRAAWKRLMFNTFHDVLCGSLLESAQAGVEAMYGYAQDVARRVITRSQHAALPINQPEPDTIPVYVLNPHSTPLCAPVGLNFLSAYSPQLSRAHALYTLYDDAGAPVRFQTKGGSSTVLDSGDWQPFVGFMADVPPLSARRYEIRFEDSPQFSDKFRVFEDEVTLTVENDWWQMSFSHELAAPVSLLDKFTGQELLSGPVQITAMADTAHAWGGEHLAEFNQAVGTLTALKPMEVGAFAGMDGDEAKEGPALRVIVQGAAWVTVECLVGWQHTRASLQFTLYAELPYIDINTRLYMQARRKMMKLMLPFDLPEVRALCEVPYGSAERAADGTEWPYARWLRLESVDSVIGLANNGQSGFHVEADGKLGLSLSRGAVHCHWDEDEDGLDTARSFTYMDQEQIDTRFRLLGSLDVATDLISAALELNQPLERFFTYYPPGAPENAPMVPAPFLHVHPPTITLGALKKAEHEDALIIRMVETIGQATTAQISFERDASRSVDFRPFEIKTFKVVRCGNEINWQLSNLLEEA